MSVLRSLCPICQTSEKLLRCQGCMVMLYCCREHQIDDRNNHKRICNAVKKAEGVLEREERKLRAAPPDIMLPANVFETAVGHFWGIMDTRDYMRARYSLVEKLVKIKTYDAVKAAFDHTMDMIRLCRGDNMGLRFMVPAMFIQLGMDQECYDFMKWHVTTGARDDYDWGNMDLPFLDVKGADVFEPVNLFTEKWADFEFAVALFLIKMRLLNDVKTLQNSLSMYDDLPLPPELVDRIRKEAIAGGVVSKRRDILMSKNQKPLMEALEEHIKQLFNFVKRNHKHFWPGLLDPAEYLAARPATFTRGSVEEAQITVQYYYDAYVETPESIQMIREMVMDTNG